MPALGGFTSVTMGFTVEAGVVDRFWVRNKKDAPQVWVVLERPVAVAVRSSLPKDSLQIPLDSLNFSSAVLTTADVSNKVVQSNTTRGCRMS
jgi:hypothetical protein